MFLRKMLGVIFIIGVLFPMLLFLNPFAWVMRTVPEYVSSPKLEKVLERMKKEINEKEEIEVDTYDNEPNLWYLRDCDNQKLDSLTNFNIGFSEVKDDKILREKIKKFAPLIEKEIDCKCYDSLFFVYELKKEESSNTERDLAKRYGFEKETLSERISIGFKIKNQ